jgi:hypothetical protein
VTLAVSGQPACGPPRRLAVTTVTGTKRGTAGSQLSPDPLPGQGELFTRESIVDGGPVGSEGAGS